MGLKATRQKIYDVNLAQNQSYIYVTRKKNASSIYNSWKGKKAIHWSKYQIKETDMRQKTASFSSPHYFDLTTGVYMVMITSPYHEDFGGVILSVEYDEDSGLYDYQCQDFSRNYMSKVDIVANTKVHRLLKHLLSRGGIPLKGTVSKTKKKNYYPALTGLRPAYQYEQKYFGSVIRFNPMTQKRKLIIRDKSWIEAIRDVVYGTGAYVDVYFDKYGLIHIEPFHKEDMFNSGLQLFPEEVATRKFKFDTTNIITGVTVMKENKKKVGKKYTSKNLVTLDLTAFFGDVSTSVNNPNNTQVKKKSKSSNGSSKKSSSASKTDNIYGTKNKEIWLNIDNIDGYNSDMNKMKTMKRLLNKHGWKVHIVGIGPSTHYDKRGECKKGIWFTLYGGLCGGTLRESCENSWFLNPLKRNKSRVVVGFFPPVRNGILKGGRYYKHLGPAPDWEGSQSYANINYPAKFMSSKGVPWMIAENATKMVSKFLAGGDNYVTKGSNYRNYGSWTKHDVKWIK